MSFFNRKYITSICNDVRMHELEEKFVEENSNDCIRREMK